MERIEPATIAGLMYYQHIMQRGCRPPQNSHDLLTLISSDGVEVQFCEDAPEDFKGLQINNTILVNLNLAADDRKLMRVLAHEWAHFLRKQGNGTALRVWLYQDGANSSGRPFEENIASAFEKLF